MKKELITAIAEGNFSAILSITSQLTDSERYSTIAAIKDFTAQGGQFIPVRFPTKERG